MFQLNPLFLLYAGLLFIFIEVVFFLYCFKWLSEDKTQRTQELAKMDEERAELLSVQGAIHQEAQEMKGLGEKTLKKITILASDNHKECEDFSKKITQWKQDFETIKTTIFKELEADFKRHYLAFEKIHSHVRGQEKSLEEKIQQALQLIKLFDTNLPTEHLLKEIQVNRYHEAQELIKNGVDASAIARKTGLSLSEVVLLSDLG